MTAGKRQVSRVKENIMARIVGAVDFADGKRLYFIFDRATEIALRPLFESKEDARQ